MNAADLITVRKKAEQAVDDMADGPLKLKAFEVILGSLLAGPQVEAAVGTLSTRSTDSPPRKSASSVSSRIALLAEEGFFREPRSLAEIQAKLAEHGWFYPQPNLSTPLIRLVRQRELRRLQLMNGGKKLWKYALP